MSGFDRLAKPYRWMEYLSFGRALERCRFRFLPQLTDAKHALVLGDGDGRFAARLLRAAPDVVIDAVDASPAMLAALHARCGGERVVTHCADLSVGLPDELAAQRFDVVTTHFFLDCLTTAQVALLAQQLRPLLAEDARWVVSEFAVPERGAMRWASRVVVRCLYVGFRLLTGLRAQQLPAYHDALQREGFAMVESVSSLGGLLMSEMWRKGA